MGYTTLSGWKKSVAFEPLSLVYVLFYFLGLPLRKNTHCKRVNGRCWLTGLRLFLKDTNTITQEQCYKVTSFLWTCEALQDLHITKWSLSGLPLRHGRRWPLQHVSPTFLMDSHVSSEKLTNLSSFKCCWLLLVSTLLHYLLLLVWLRTAGIYQSYLARGGPANS